MANGDASEWLEGTGVELRVHTERSLAEEGNALPKQTGIPVEAQVFAEVRDFAPERVVRIRGSSMGPDEVPIGEDPTSVLLRIADQARTALGDLLGDMRASGTDITRWEFFSAPFRIELDPELAAELRKYWDHGPPRSMPQ